MLLQTNSYLVPREKRVEHSRLLGRFRQKGVAAVFTPRRGVRKYADARYKEMVFKILHAPPKEYGFNRATWRLKDLHAVMARVGLPISKTYIDRIIRDGEAG